MARAGIGVAAVGLLGGLLLVAATPAHARYTQGAGVARVVGGASSTISQFPFMASLQLQLGGGGAALQQHACAGALLTSRTLLSAAQCFHEGEAAWAGSWAARLGATELTVGTAGQGVLVAAEALMLHEEFTGAGTLQHDLAVVRLAAMLTLGEDVAPVRIGSAAYTLPDGTALQVVGWGATQEGGAVSGQLHVASVTQVNHAVCAARYNELAAMEGYELWPSVTQDMICSGILNVGGADACEGDVGAPLLHNSNVAVGVTSWGFGCGHDYFPRVNTRLTSYVDWIALHGST